MRKQGFTLVELLVTTAIIGLLAATGTVSYSYVRMKARDAKRVSDIKTIRSGVETFFEQNSRYPTVPPLGLTLGHDDAKVLSDAGFTPFGRENGLIYLGNVPANVLPGGLPYLYRTTEMDSTDLCVGQCYNYEITFALESPTGDLVAGPHKMTPDGTVGPENDPDYKPPSFLAQYVPSAEDLAAALGSVGEIDELRKQVVEQPEVQTVAAVATPVAAVASIANLTAVVATVVPIASAGNVFVFFIFQPILLFGRRKRANWGTVYHAGTKVPVDLATVRLIDAKTDRAVAVKVTDKDGRYAFNPPPGTYRIEVQKLGFVFPATSVMNLKDDGKFPDIYHGTLVRVEQQGTTLTLNIPLDPKEDADAAPIVGSRNRMTLGRLVASGGPIIGVLTLIIAPSIMTVLLLLLHLAVYAIFKRLATAPEPKAQGVVYEEGTKKPVDKAVVRVLSLPYNKVLETRVTGPNGQYSFYVGNGTYYVTVNKPGYQKTETSPIDFTGIDKPTFIASDLPLRKTESSV